MTRARRKPTLTSVTPLAPSMSVTPSSSPPRPDSGLTSRRRNSPEDLFKKLTNFGHHDEFELSGLTIDDLKKRISEKKVLYNHLVDQSSQNKWNYDYKLKKIGDALLPKYLQDNKKKYNEWID